MLNRLLIASTLLMLPACSGDDDDDDSQSPPPADQATFCDVQEFVFNPTCLGCHTTSSPLGGLDLTEGKSYAALVDVQAAELTTMDRVEPGSVDDSYLYHKLVGTHLEVGGSGGQMPLGGPVLEADLVALVESWISRGASESCEAPGDDPTPTQRPDVTPTPGGETPTPPAAFSLCDVQESVFNARCVSCHSGAQPTGNLDLSPAKAFDQLVNVKAGQSALDRIEPGDSSRSYLYHKLIGTHRDPPANGTGAQMPQGSAPLDEDLINIVKGWIDNGAEESCDPGQATPTPEPDRLELCGVQDEVFTPSCLGSGCHSGNLPSSGLNLSSGVSYDALIDIVSRELTGMDRVEPRNVAESYLYHKLVGTHADVGGSGDRMPKGRTPISAQGLILVSTWIQAGAPEFCQSALSDQGTTDTVVIVRAESEPGLGNLQVEGFVTGRLSEDGFAATLELFTGGASGDGRTCTGDSLGNLSIDVEDGRWQFRGRDLEAIPEAVCVESELGGVASATVVSN